MTLQNNQSNSELTSLVKELPEEIAPNRDLWAGIEQAVAELPQNKQQKSDANWSVVTKLAASFTPVALVVGLWFAQQPEQTSAGLELNPISASYQVQKQILLQKVSSETKVISNLESSLKELNEAEKALVKALQSQPGEPALINMLNQVYRRQLELIEKAHLPDEKVKYSQI